MDEIGGIIGVLVTMFFVGIVFRGVFPKTYRWLNDKVSAWADAPEHKSKAPQKNKAETEYQVGIKHQ